MMTCRLALLTVLCVLTISLTGCGSLSGKQAKTDGPRSHSDPTPVQMESAATAASPLIGMMAPDFTLPNQDGQPVKLTAQRGKWVVLYFYPKDDTPGCACQATDFTDLLQEFRDMNAVILGVSPDTIDDHRYFGEKYHLKLTLLSDQDKRVMRQYGAWVEATMAGDKGGRVVRSTLIIDPQGRIAHHWPEVIPTGHAKRVREKLESLQSQR